MTLSQDREAKKARRSFAGSAAFPHRRVSAGSAPDSERPPATDSAWSLLSGPVTNSGGLPPSRRHEQNFVPSSHCAGVASVCHVPHARAAGSHTPLPAHWLACHPNDTGVSAPAREHTSANQTSGKIGRASWWARVYISV